MTKFDKRFVHFMWSDELEGKEVFYSDSITLLVAYVNGNNRDLFGTVSHSNNPCYPFGIRGNDWKFVYYDPLYDLKVANEQGKKIQFHNYDGEWMDMYECEFLAGVEYRIKPDESKPVTNRELARWLAKGNGEYQMRKGNQFSCFNEYSYDAKDANEPTEIPCVRKWGDAQWHEPTRKYMGLEE